MRFRTTAALSTAVVALVAGQLPAAAAASTPTFTPGAVDVGDPYFPGDGNGGYDVLHYELDLAYDPQTDVLDGVAAVSAVATQDLLRFNLDLDGLEVRAIAVDGRPATWGRIGQELVVTPAAGIPQGYPFAVVVTYGGVPAPLDDGPLGENGVFTTDDGMIAIGQPHGATSWFPANDHPSDAASYRFRVTVPEGLEAVANGYLEDASTRHGRTTWTWSAPDPMASYLATVAVGEFDVQARTADGIDYWDAVDPALDPPLGSPGDGGDYLITQPVSSSYQRLGRTLTVPAGGAQLSFAVELEPGYSGGDAFFVEAAPTGTDTWTTLPDAGSANTQDPASSCPFQLEVHPFLAHYLSATDDGTCTATGTTGQWWAATTATGGPQQWTVDLSAYAGSSVDVRLSYATDDYDPGRGVVLDDVRTTTGEGATSFEDDGDVLDGWQLLPAPEGSPQDAGQWLVGDETNEGASPGTTARGALARQPEIASYLEGLFGPYPFGVSGGTVDESLDVAFALETQTRSVYGEVFFTDPEAAALDGATYVVAHEMTHQWFGDDVRLARWQDIWLNEGLATWAEWSWGASSGLDSVQERFDAVASIPADDPFWTVAPGDPGPDALFDGAVYDRGGATLVALGDQIGDDALLEVFRRWAAEQSGQAVTTEQFSALAEEVSGQDLDAFFQEWLYSPTKPAGLPEAPPEAAPES